MVPRTGLPELPGILRLQKRYSPERLEAACARALECHALSYRSVEQLPGKRILQLKGRQDMLNEQTLEKLYALKLNGMADAFREQLQQPVHQRVGLRRALRPALDRQWNWKEDSRMKRYLQAALLKLHACVEDIDYPDSPAGLIAPC